MRRICFALIFALLGLNTPVMAEPPAGEKQAGPSKAKTNKKFSRPYIPVYTAEGVTESCELALEQAQRNADRIAETPIEQANVANVLFRWDAMTAQSEEIIGPIYLLAYVHPDKAIRDAGEACIVKATAFETSLYQNPELYERVEAVDPDEDIDEKFREDLLNAFIDTGVNLPEQPRKRAKTILERIQTLYQEFNRNLRENPKKLSFTPAEQKGLPDNYLQRVGKDENGNITVGFDYPDFVPFITNAENASARERYYRAFLNRGTERNIEILDEIVALRLEIAQLHDMDSYAELITQRYMVEEPDTVHDFLDDVAEVVHQAEIAELAELSRLKAEHLNQPVEETEIEPWDKSFYLERLRRSRYDIDQEALRKYFPTPETLQWILAMSAELYGIRFEARHVPLWHEDVLYYDVRDAKSGAFIGGMYLDLYPREGKYGHAAAFPVRGASTRINRTPISVLVTNFDRQGLNFREVETFLHEIGHVLHGVLSKTRYVNHAGTNVERDFVEAPSQMFEAWARRPETLRLLKVMCEACPVIDDELAERLDAARRLGSGLTYAR
ncbi:MAG: M3 family metallopeptidase, partial [Salinisphaeraceae bacterium]|nr:M3 family metallopeptidase [Salinisphaeraceae bacterium]